ncbi:MAG TPA: hypothetical protein VMH35_14960 [Streptosporangiaceae bacterium]|nr:hypothetical protein [Streptosporangiaceae bacterium]
MTSRGPADPLVIRGPRPSRLARLTRHRAGSIAVLSHSHPDEPGDELTGLISLGGLLPDRLAATVIASWAERLRGPAGARTGAVIAARPALHAALSGRVTAALRAWAGRPNLRVTLTMIPEGQPPQLTGDADGMVAELPFGWLADVWIRGLSTCWGRFCLAAAPSPGGDGWVLSTVGPDLGQPGPITIGRPPAPPARPFR